MSVRMADPQNHVHAYNTRSKNQSKQLLKDVDDAIIANSPVYTGSSPFVMPVVKLPFMTTAPAWSSTTQTATPGFLRPVVSNLFTTYQRPDHYCCNQLRGNDAYDFERLRYYWLYTQHIRDSFNAYNFERLRYYW